MSDWTRADAVRRDDEASELEAINPELGWGQTASVRDRRELLALVRELVGRETALLQRLGDVYWPESQDPLFRAELLDSEWQEMSRIQYGLRREATAGVTE